MQIVQEKKELHVPLGKKILSEEAYSNAFKHSGRAWMLCFGGAILSILPCVIYFIRAQSNPVIEMSAFFYLESIIIAASPGVFWLILFFLPKSQKMYSRSIMLKMIILGMIIANIDIVIQTRIFVIDTWLIPLSDTSKKLFGFILIVAFTQEFLKYCILRFTLLTDTNYTHKNDSIVYAACVGLGFAIMVNIDSLTKLETIGVFESMINTTNKTLLHVATALITGYFLSLTKFVSTAFWIRPLGLLSAACVNGFIQTMIETSGRIGIDYSPFLSLVGTLFSSLIIFEIIYFLTRKMEEPYWEEDNE